MSNDTFTVPFKYNDQPVRVATIDGEPWFVLADLCKVLDLPNRAMVARRLDDDMKGVTQIDTPGGRQEMTIVSESGMYEVVIRSDKPEAVAFRRWITGTVLPEIRKTGTFNAQPALHGPELVAAALIEASQMLEAKDARIAQLNDKIAVDAPKVGYVNQFVTDADCLTFSTVASTLNVTEKWLRELLVERDWIYVQTDSRWSETKGCKVTRNRYSEKADKKRYFRRIETHEAPRFRGSEVMHTLKITPAGAEAIARLVGKAIAS